MTHPNHLATVRFKRVTETKGAVRYIEVDSNGKELKTDADGMVIGTLYLRKAKLNGKEPAELTMDLDTSPTA